MSSVESREQQLAARIADDFARHDSVFGVRTNAVQALQLEQDELFRKKSAIDARLAEIGRRIVASGESKLKHHREGADS